MPSCPEKRCANCGAMLPADQTADGRALRCASCGAVAATYDTVREDGAVNKPPAAPASPDETRRDPARTDLSGPPTVEATPNHSASDTSLCLPPPADADDSSLNSPTVAYRPTASGTEPLSGSLNLGPTPTPRQIGRFCVLSVLGHGAFGNVYRAFDPLLDREVALKVPRFLGDDLALRLRFMREAKAAARLRHPNIVAIFECGHADDSPYIAAEFVDGVPLSAVLRERRLETRTAVDWVRQIAEALHYAHSEGVIHRDIKPANIMVSKAGRPQVMDFGLSKRIADETAQLSVEGQVIGTPAYMAPEQAKGNLAAIGPHSDQYGVAVVLYQMLCGRTPYAGDALSQLAQLTDERTAPTPPRSIRGDVPRDLEACCLKAMEKDPAARYPSLQAFADDLKCWLDGRPLTARPIGVSEQLVRWCRKNRLIAFLAGTLAALVVVIAIVGYIMAFQFRDLADTATREANAAKQSREQEKAARLNTEQMLIDIYTKAGLDVEHNGDAREAILWFANAAARAENHPLREKHNRMRVQSWLAEVAVPVHAFEPPGTWNEALLFHPSGRYLLSQSNAPACEIRDLSDGKVVPLPIDQRARAAVWSPDGRWLALAAQERVAVFEFPEGREIASWAHPERVTALAFSPDGKRVAVGGHKSARVRDVLAESFVTPSLEHGGRVLTLAFSPDGGRLATGCADHMVRAFDVRADASAEPILPPQLSAHTGKDVPPVFLGSNRLVVANCPVTNKEQQVRCWDLDAKRIAWRHPTKRSLCMTPSPKGDLLAVGDHFDVVFLDAATGKQVGGRVGHRNLAADVAFHPSGKLLLSGSLDQTARLSRVPGGEAVIGVIPHQDTAHRCVWSPDGAVFATVHWGDQLIRVWKLGRPDARDFTLPAASRRPFLKTSRDGKYLLPAGIDAVRDSGPLQVYDAVTGAAVGKAIAAPGPISDAAFVPQTSLAAIAAAAVPQADVDVRRQNLDQPGIVRFVDFQTGATPFADVVTSSDPVAVECSPDGRRVVALCHRGQVLILDAATGKVLHQHQAFGGLSANLGFVIRDRIRFAPDGDRFVIWGAGRQVEMRDASSGELLFTVAHPKDNIFIHDVQFSPDGNTLATCCSDMTVCLWDARKGRPARLTLPHSGWVFTAQFSRDGKRLLTASKDGQARIWDVDGGQVLVATPAQRDEVQGICFLPDEEVFLIGTRDGNISAWDAGLGKMLAPCRRLGKMVHQLTLTGAANAGAANAGAANAGAAAHVVASGRVHPIAAFDLADWIRPGDESLPPVELRRLGEIVSAQWIHEGGAPTATGLSKDEWLERWRDFHANNPGHPALSMPPAPAAAQAIDQPRPTSP